MSAESILTYLRELCRDIDEGRSLKPFVRKAFLPVALPAALALGTASLAGCEHSDGSFTTPGPTPAAEHRCDDGVDDDGDGLVDCADSDCGDAQVCPVVVDAAPMPAEPSPPVPAYGVPPHHHDPGLSVPEYGAPYPGDDAQPGEPDPGPVAEYAAPFEPDGAVVRYAAPMPRLNTQ